MLSNTMDEIKALEQINEIMSRFSSKEQRRMIWWLNSRLVQRVETEIKERAELQIGTAVSCG